MSEVRGHGRAKMVGRDVFRHGQTAQKMQWQMLRMPGLPVIGAAFAMAQNSLFNIKNAARSVSEQAAFP